MKSILLSVLILVMASCATVVKFPVSSVAPAADIKANIKNDNAQKMKLQTLTSFHPKEIFITAEEDGNVTFPSGIEISRAVISRN